MLQRKAEMLQNKDNLILTEKTRALVEMRKTETNFLTELFNKKERYPSEIVKEGIKKSEERILKIDADLEITLANDPIANTSVIHSTLESIVFSI
jgi:hypothetical protein